MDPRVGVAIGIAGYLALIGLIAVWAVRRSRRKLDERVDGIAAAVAASGGKRVRESRLSHYRSKSVECEADGKRMWIEAYAISRDYVRVNYRLPTDTPLPHIRIHRERGLDRFGKRIRLNREVQTGDAEFDAAAYIDSRDRDEDVLAVLGHADTRAAVRELLSLGYAIEFSRRGIETYQIVHALRPTDTETSARAAALSARLARHMPSFHVSQLVPQRDWTDRKAQAVGMATACAAVFLVGGAAAMNAHGATIEPRAQLMAVGIGAAVYFLLMVALTMRLRGRSDALGNLILAALFGAGAVPLGIGGLVLWLNARLDHNPPRAVVTTVTSIARKGNSISVESWRGTRPERVPVDRPLKRSLKPGDHVRVQSHPGAFGWEWAEAVHERAP
jgi:hypothetical protein